MNTLRGIVPGRSLTYNDEDQLVTNVDNNYLYDPDGYLVNVSGSWGAVPIVYSTRGELLNLTMPDGRVLSYVYDPLGRRIAKKVNGITTEKYLWAGQTTLLAVYDGADNLVMRFEYADGRMPVAMTQGGNTYYLAYDQVGSLRVVTDASGTVVKRIDYDTFGNVLNDTAPTFAMPFGFAGGLRDVDTGLVHFGYRDYEPETGRWIQKDPVGFAGGDVNLYGYCLDDPVNYADPSGRYLVLLAIEAADVLLDFLAGASAAGFMDLMEQIRENKANGRPTFCIDYDRLFNAMGFGGAGAFLGEAFGQAGKIGNKISNSDLIKDIARRAEDAIGGKGRVAGTKKHKYAKDLLDRYQRRFGDRGLITESSWINGKEAYYGQKGSVRIDVWDTNNSVAYDYKFTTKPPGLGQRQIDKILDNGPGGLGDVFEVNP